MTLGRISSTNNEYQVQLTLAFQKTCAQEEDFPNPLWPHSEVKVFNSLYLEIFKIENIIIL